MTASEFLKAFVDTYNSISDREITEYSFEPNISDYQIKDFEEFWCVYDTNSMWYSNIVEYNLVFNDHNQNVICFEFKIPPFNYKFNIVELTLLKLGFINTAFAISYIKASKASVAFYETFKSAMELNDMELMQYILDIDLYDKFLSWAEHNRIFRDDRKVDIKSVLEKVLMDDKEKNIHANTSSDYEIY